MAGDGTSAGRVRRRAVNASHPYDPSRCLHKRVRTFTQPDGRHTDPEVIAVTVCGREVNYQLATGSWDNVCCPSCVAVAPKEPS